MINQFRKGILMKYRINMSNIFGRLCELLNSFVQLYTRYILDNIKYSHDFDFALQSSSRLTLNMWAGYRTRLYIPGLWLPANHKIATIATPIRCHLGLSVF